MKARHRSIGGSEVDLRNKVNKQIRPIAIIQMGRIPTESSHRFGGLDRCNVRGNFRQQMSDFLENHFLKQLPVFASFIYLFQFSTWKTLKPTRNLGFIIGQGIPVLSPTLATWTLILLTMSSVASTSSNKVLNSTAIRSPTATVPDSISMPNFSFHTMVTLPRYL